MFDLNGGDSAALVKRLSCLNAFSAGQLNSGLVVPRASTDFISITPMKNAVFTADLLRMATVASRPLQESIFTVMGAASVFTAAPS
jgi:hypothetical protein